MASNLTNTAPVKRACDSCHRRKVKCIGEGNTHCKNCVSAGLACTYNAIPQKKGPKGSRAKVLSELRESQRNAQLATGFSPDAAFDARSVPPTYARTQGLLPAGLVESCVDFFFANIYPTEPILHRQGVQEAVMNMECSTEAYCMVVALSAYVMIQGNMKVSSSLLSRPEMAQMSNIGLGHVLLEESVRIRKAHDYRETPTYLTVITSWFYCGSYFGLARENTAWTYLQEATTQAQLLGMHDEETYKHDLLDASQKRVLYWQLFMAERTFALHKHRPISLYPTIHPPSLEDLSSNGPIAVFFEVMINMFKIIDDTFVNLWNRVHAHANPAWIAQLHTQISDAVPAYLECTEAQAAMVRITQQWLRAQAWQLCVSQGLVSSVSSDVPLTFRYPIEISRDLLAITHQFSQQAMEVHGIGLIEKLFDIACCLTDVVACTSFSPDAFGLGPRDYISRLLTLISTLRGGQSRYLPLLLAKISEVLPSFPLPRSLSLSQTTTTSSIGVTGIGSGTIPSNVGNDFSAMPTATSPSYPSTEMIRRLAGQPGAQLPFNTQQSIMSAPTSHVEDLSIYDSSHSTTQTSDAGARSNSTTPGPFEPPMTQSRSQIASHNPMQVPTSHPQHGHMQNHHAGVSPTAYDPRFAIQGYPGDHNMVFKR